MAIERYPPLAETATCKTCGVKLELYGTGYVDIGSAKPSRHCRAVPGDSPVFVRGQGWGDWHDPDPPPGAAYNFRERMVLRWKARPRGPRAVAAFAFEHVLAVTLFGLLLGTASFILWFGFITGINGPGSEDQSGCMDAVNNYRAEQLFLHGKLTLVDNLRLYVKSNECTGPT